MKKVIICALALMLGGCATTHFQRADVLKRDNSISALKEKLDEGRMELVDLLSPSYFDEAAKKLEMAVKTAQTSENPNAGDDIAKEGLNVLRKAFDTANKARDTFKETLRIRGQALTARADIIYPQEFVELEDMFKTAGKHFENGQMSDVYTFTGKLKDAYIALEVKALKEGLNAEAAASYEQAKKMGAHKLAPITFKAAEKELEVAQKIIEIEPDNIKKAHFHSGRARDLALKSRGIAEVVTKFKKENLSYEQVVLWYQSQLEEINKPLEDRLDFSQNNFDVVGSFKKSIKENVDYVKELEDRDRDSQKKIASLNEKIANLVGEQERLRIEKGLKEENFQAVSKIFNQEEAEVLRENNNIIIRSHGFYFPVGTAEVQPRNFTLLNKIVSAILKFPKKNISVEGHTDGTGSNQINQKLSEQRASNIADFLVKIAGIDESKVVGVGFGSQKPIASDSTPEGRSKNRRIDIVIKDAI